MAPDPFQSEHFDQRLPAGAATKRIESITKEYINGISDVREEFLKRVDALRKKADNISIDELQEDIKTESSKQYEQQSDTEQTW